MSKFKKTPSRIDILKIFTKGNNKFHLEYMYVVKSELGDFRRKYGFVILPTDTKNCYFFIFSTIIFACTLEFSINHLCVSMPPQITPAKNNPFILLSIVSGLY